MSDLISRQAALDALGEDPCLRLPFVDEWADEYFLGLIRQYNNDKDAIMSVPTIEPKKGKWKIGEKDFGGYFDIECTACGWGIRSTGEPPWDYCPNCGARMEGE